MSIAWPEGVQVEESDASGTPCFDVPAGRWVEVVTACHAAGFTYFDWLSAVDEPDAVGERVAGADVVVHLVAPRPLRRIILRARIPADDAEIASLTRVFAGAAWHERETHEMFGIGFTGFDDGSGLGLRPLLLPDGFEGTPLRSPSSSRRGPSRPGPGPRSRGRAVTATRPRRRAASCCRPVCRTPPPGVRVTRASRPGRSTPRSRTPRRRARRPARGATVADVLEVVLRAVCVLAAFLVLPLLVGQTEHKVMAHMQGRLGPMYAGSFHGWAQLVADGVKFVQKEDSVPAAADRTVFKLAPGVALVPYLVALAAIPLAPGIVGADVDAGLLFVLAVSAVGVLGTLMGGWASGNKYSLLGGMRTAAQLLA